MRTAAHLAPFRSVDADHAGQDELPDHVLLAHLPIDRLLGAGGFGAVFACTLNLPGVAVGLPLALKAPTSLFPQQVDVDPHARTLARVAAPDAVLYPEALREFAREFALGELVVDTPTLAAAYAGRAMAGARVARLPNAQFMQHVGEAGAMAAHPGHAHLLHVVHFCPSIPCLLMQPCDGSSLTLYEAGALHAEAHRFAAHVILAVECLRDVSGLANADLKFDNVMYRALPGDGRPHFVLVDYGGCGAVARPWAEHCVCTVAYSPPMDAADAYGLPVWDPLAVTPLEVSLYQLALMLLFLLVPGTAPDQNGAAFVVADIPVAYAPPDRVAQAALDLLRASSSDCLRLFQALRQTVPGLPNEHRPAVTHAP